MKETEKRADRWRLAFGVEQTEIDALATLQPDVLREIIERAFDPYFDSTLEDRVDEARADWMQRAQTAIDEQVDPEILAALRTEAAERLAELESVITDINERLRLAADNFTLPSIEVPEPEIDEAAERHALMSFDDSWITATRALIARKQYGKHPRAACRARPRRRRHARLHLAAPGLLVSGRPREACRPDAASW